MPAFQAGPGQPIILNPHLGDANIRVPCRKCLGCRTEKAKTWAARAVHEAYRHQYNRFLTLTYAPEHLPPDGGLRGKDLADFWKRYRASLLREPDLHLGDQLRYLACGEYGERTRRPHYHACVFGTACADERRWKKDLWRSDTLERLWGHGEVTIGTFTGASAMYIAQYTVKKMAHDKYYITADGELLEQPFVRASKRPAIGKVYARAYADELAGNGYIVLDNRKQKIPEYYRKVLRNHAPQHAAELEIRLARTNEQNHKLNSQNTNEQLANREIIHAARRTLTAKPPSF